MEMSIAIIMSAGVGLAGILSGYVKNAANFTEVFCLEVLYQ